MQEFAIPLIFLAILGFIAVVYVLSLWANAVGCSPQALVLMIPVMGLVIWALLTTGGPHRDTFLWVGKWIAIIVGTPIVLGLVVIVVQQILEWFKSSSSETRDPFHREAPCKYCGRSIVTNRQKNCPKCKGAFPFPFVSNDSRAQ